MSVVSVLGVILILFALAWRFEDTLLGVAPLVMCAMGLALYVLAFFGRLSLIDWILTAGGLWALAVMVGMTRRQGRAALGGALRRLLGDPHVWMCVVILLVMCLCLGGEQILEWDGYNYWGPDTKSLFYRDGFAPMYSNAASRFGDYTPMPQLIWWWFTHLAGSYQEQYVFMGYYIFGGVLLFGVADRFRSSKKPWNVIMAALACGGAVVLPGVACTAWFRAIYVDPLMAILFGLILSLIVCRSQTHPGFWKAKLLVLTACLTLIKSIGILWAVLALAFFCLWWLKEKREWRFALLCGGGAAVCWGSWWVFCRVMERTTALVSGFPAAAAQRLQELRDGVFLTAGNNRGYLASYAKAFLFTPIHRESTPAVDLTPAALVVILFAAAVLLWRFGLVPRKKGGRLLVFMGVTLGVIYLVMVVGQLTMFYTETKYLEPLNAVTLMTRYCAPAHMGLLLLMVTFAGGQAAGAELTPPGSPRRVVAAVAAAAVVFSCGAYTEMWRRFRYDPLDGQRIELRERYCAQYEDFLTAIRGLPLDQPRCRVLLCVYQTSVNPIVINEASPVSFWTVTLSGNGAEDLALIREELERTHAGYLYLDASGKNAAQALSQAVGYPVETGVLYRVTGDGPLELEGGA